MNVINSAPSYSQDDTDVTMINHSLLYDGNDEPISSCIPIVRRQQANQSKSTNNNPPNSDDRQDYIYVNQELSGTVKQIEQILNYYRQDLKQESNTQLDCNQQLITRLIDFIRPVYSSNENEMKDLDILYENISALHEKRFDEEKEKMNQLNNQIRHLKKSIITTPIEDNTRESLMTNLYRMNSMYDYQQWIEVEEETKKLQNLVQTQREQIDNLIELLSQMGTTCMNNRQNILSLILEITKDEQSPPLDLPIREVPVQEYSVCNHAEKSLVASNVSMESKQLECPYCNEKFLNNDGVIYIEHLSQCFNELTGSF